MTNVRFHHSMRSVPDLVGTEGGTDPSSSCHHCRQRMIGFSHGPRPRKGSSLQLVQCLGTTTGKNSGTPSPITFYKRVDFKGTTGPLPDDS